MGEIIQKTDLQPPRFAAVKLLVMQFPFLNLSADTLGIFGKNSAMLCKFYRPLVANKKLTAKFFFQAEDLAAESGLGYIYLIRTFGKIETVCQNQKRFD
jgi:hypothetical protein